MYTYIQQAMLDRPSEPGPVVVRVRYLTSSLRCCGFFAGRFVVGDPKAPRTFIVDT